MPVPNPENTQRFVLAFACPCDSGLTHAIVSTLMKFEGVYIYDLKQFDDLYTERFFIRVDFSVNRTDSRVLTEMRAAFAQVAQNLSGDFSITPKDAKTRTLIMVSKSDHCLNDLLYRSRIGALPIEIVGVVSNHPDNKELVEWHGIDYHHIPVTKETKDDAERQLLALVDKLDVELVVLARYMQILSDELSRKLEGRVINIHHSFLPAFKGAKPYHQAYARGVKTIGATAHYVNEELDEGPIISQQLIHVDHAYGPEDLVAAGRDSECKALAEAVRLHCESRVFLNGTRTVVLK